jgi:hypothetical protein
MMFLDWQFTAQNDEYLDPARYQCRQAFILVDAIYRDVPVMWCPYIYVTTTPRLRAVGREGFQRKWVVFFRRARLRPSRDAGCTRQPIWREPLRAWPTSYGSLRDLAQAGRRWTVSPLPPRSLIAILPEIGRRLPGQAGGQRAGDVNRRQSDRSRCMDREGRAQFSGNEWRRTPHTRAETDRVRVPLLALLLR